MIETNSYDKSIILNDFVKLQQYLYDVYTLESEYYSLRETRNRLDDEIMQLGRQRVIKDVDSFYSNILAEFFGNLVNIGIFVLGSISLVVAIFIVGAIFFGIDFFTVGIAIKACLILDFIICIGVVFKFYQSMKTERNNKQIRVQENICKKKAEQKRVNEELQLIPEYKKTLQDCEENIEQCEKILERLYAVGIIFPKYRNFIAVSQIYEYLISGRCKQLEGKEGAYSLYEQELRMDTISSKLADIFDEMEKIRENQYMIYETINQVNQRLGIVLDYEAVVAYNTKVIVNNAEICMRYCIY